MGLPVVPLSQGIHVVHLFFRINRLRWSTVPPGESRQAIEQLLFENLPIGLSHVPHLFFSGHDIPRMDIL